MGRGTELLTETGNANNQIELIKMSGNNRINAGRRMFGVCMVDKVYLRNNWMQVTNEKRL